MRLITTFLIFGIFLLFNSCSATACAELDISGLSYAQAESAIRAGSFTYSNKVITRKSTWIVKAEYYSCDNKKGYFILTTKKKSYLFHDMPKSVWKDFKKAPSYGKFYNAHIRGKY